MRIRQPAVAGMFYPASPVALEREVLDLLEQARQQRDAALEPPPRALIVPHAGYPYSGPVAASAYTTLRPYRQHYRRVVLLGPAHRVYVPGMAIPSVEAFDTPLGSVLLDSRSLERLAGMPAMQVSDEAHALEHSLEVQLPFLCEVLEDFVLVPIVVGDCEPQPLAQVLELFVDDPQTLIVVSSDLSHYHRYEDACRRDAQTAAAISRCSLSLAPEQACGARAINGLTLLCAQRGFEIRELDRRNSGDTAGGRDRVVGYGAYVVR
jgi:AmmeMemoRadiSam system protein B